MKKIIVLLVILSIAASAVAQEQRVGMIGSLEVSSFKKIGDAYSIGKSVWGGTIVKLTQDLWTIGAVEYSDNGIQGQIGDDATTIGGFVGFGWDWLTIKDWPDKRPIEAFLLFQGGAEEVRIDGFDPTTRFAWLTGVGVKFPIKDTKMLGAVHIRLVSVSGKDADPSLYKVAAGFSIYSDLLTK